MSNRKTRHNRAKGRGRVSAGSGGSGASLAPDDLVFGNADQLRRMAEALRRGDPSTRAQACASARARVSSYQQRYPDADLAQLVGRPLCEVDTPPRPDVTRPQVRVVVDAATDGGHAELWVDGHIEPPSMWGDGVSARDIREALDEVGHRPVVVHINSGGGDYFEGVAIHQALVQHPGDVYVAVDALAASAASVVAMAGDTIGIGDGAFIMIHEASAFAYGNSDDLLRTADMLDAIGGEIAGFYARRGGGDAAAFREAMRTETWYGPTAAIEAGLADERLQLPTVDQTPIDTDDEDDDVPVIDPEIENLFDWARPAASAAAPPPTPEPDPGPGDPPPADWSSLFRDDMEELFA